MIRRNINFSKCEAPSFKVMHRNKTEKSKLITLDFKYQK